MSLDTILKNLHKFYIKHGFISKVRCHCEWHRGDDAPAIITYFYSFGDANHNELDVKSSKDSAVISSCVSGIGGSLEFAAIDYASKISGRILVKDAFGDTRREYEVPNLYEE